MGHSYIHNQTGEYIHFADDWKLENSPAGCAPCGGGTSGTASSLRPLSIRRFHRYGAYKQPGSLGAGVFLNVDVTLTALSSSVLELFDPAGALPIRLVKETGSTTFVDKYYGIISSISLFDHNGIPCTELANAERAELRRTEGQVWSFDIFTLKDASIRGRLVSCRDANGVGYAITYATGLGAPVLTPDQAWRIATIADDAGRTATVSYVPGVLINRRPIIERIDLPLGQTISYTLQNFLATGVAGSFAATLANGDAVSVQATPTAGVGLSVAFEDPAADGQHRRKTVVLSTADSMDDRWFVNLPYRIMSVTNGAGEIAYQRRLERIDPESWGMVIDEGNGRILRLVTDWNGRVKRTEYAQSAVWSQPTSTYTWGVTRQYASDARYRVNSLIDEHGTTTSVLDPASGLPLSQTDAAGQVLYERNAFGQILRETNRLGEVTDNTYDAKGNRLTRTTAFGTAGAATTTWTFNARGQLLTETDPEGHTTEYTYDPQGNLLSVTDPPDDVNGVRATVTYEYDALGRRTAAISAMNVRTTYAYDSRNRHITTTYADNSTETTTYGVGVDANLPVASKDRNGRVTTRTYDGDGRLTRVVIASGPTDLPLAQTQEIETSTYVPGTRLVASRTRDGERTDFLYDQQGRSSSVSMWKQGAAKHVQSYTYDLNGQMTCATDTYGRRTFHAFDALGREIRQVQELVVGGLPAQPDIAALTRQTGANPGYSIADIAYDAEGRMLQRTDPLGLVTRTAYLPNGRVASVTVGYGSARPLTTTYEYDLEGRQTAEVAPGPLRTEYVYTGRGLTKRVTQAAGTAESTIVRSAVYNLARELASETDALGRTTTYVYGGCCSRLQQIIDAAGFVTQFTYDAVGNRLSVTDAMLQTTTTSYDLRNRPTKTLNALAKTVLVAYDEDLVDGVGLEMDTAVKTYIASLALGANADGRMVKRTDENGKAWYEAFDGLGRSVLRVDPLGITGKTTYDTVVSGLVETGQIDGLNQTVRVRVDAQGQRRELVDAAGKVATTAYDARGQVRTVRDALGIGQDMTYDLHGWLSEVRETRNLAVPVTRRTYDDAGRLLSDMDADGRSETQVYDLRGRRLSTTDRLGTTTTFTYDAVGNLLQIRDADAAAAIAANPNLTQAQRDALTTRYAYDALNRLLRETFPSGSAGETRRIYTYDAIGRLATRKVGVADPANALGFLAGKPTETTTYTYDKGNRLTKRAYSDGSSDTFAYDGMGRLTTASSSKYGNKVTRTYDVSGRELTESLTITGGTAVNATTLADAVYVVKTTWDKANRPVNITYPDNQVHVRTYDARGLLASATFPGLSAARTYADNGRLLTTTYGNGLVETRTYVQDGNLVNGITVPGATAFTYTYDSMGRKQNEAVTGDAAQEQRFAYDWAGRLNTWSQGPVATPVHTAAWTLSAVGDWKSVVRDGQSETRSHSAVHEATVVQGSTLGYDFKGNLTTDRPVAGKPAQTYAWDPENRLNRAANLADVRSGVATYAYDALGRRISKTLDNQTTVYVHHGAQVVYEVDVQAVPSKTASTQDATMANLALTPQGLDGTSGTFLTGAVRTASVAGVTRIDFEPVSSPDAAGYLADRGRVYAKRTSNGLTYGWSESRSAGARQRNMSTLPAWDTLIEMGTGTWEILLPNGDYPVVVVAGDAAFVNQTNHLQVEDQALTDPDPDPGTPMNGYAQGDFDAWAVIAHVTDGKLTISSRTGAVNPKLCLVEIGVAGGSLPTGIQAKLDDYVSRLTTATAGSGYPIGAGGPRWFVYGSYVDEVVGYVTGSGAQVQRFYPHYNHLYSVAALTHGTNGQVVERYTYDAYGKQTITTVGDVPRVRSTVGWDRGFTGYIADVETGLLHARARQLSPTLGRFVGRDLLDYIDGMSQYEAYFVPNEVDPQGLAVVDLFADAYIPYDWVDSPLPAGGIWTHTYFKGDNRSFSPSPPSLNRTRIANWISVELCAKKKTDPLISRGNHASSSTAMDESRQRLGRRVTRYRHAANELVNPVESAIRISPCKVKVTLKNQGKNGLVAGSPYVDYSYTFILTQRKDDILVEMTGSHDGFPAYEVYVQSKALYFYTPELSGDTPLALFGSGDVSAERTASRQPGDDCCCEMP